jgi:hypothetical protein
MAGPGGRGGSDCRVLGNDRRRGSGIQQYRRLAGEAGVVGISPSCRSEARGLLPSGLPMAVAPSFPLLLHVARSASQHRSPTAARRWGVRVHRDMREGKQRIWGRFRTAPLLVFFPAAASSSRQPGDAAQERREGETGSVCTGHAPPSCTLCSSNHHWSLTDLRYVLPAMKQAAMAGSSTLSP